MIRYKCEKCGSVLKIKDRLAGTKGKCPKCETVFQVPDAPDADDAQAEAAAEADQEVSEEDAIFGKDFFTLQETPKGPRHTVAPAYPDDVETSDHVPAEATKTARPSSSANPPSVDNSSNIAGQLLSKTGKKNRPDDWQDPEEEEGGYDVSAIKYVVLYRILPLIVGGTLLSWGGYALFSDMLGTKHELPPLGVVTGQVTLDGKPAQAMLSFQPDAGAEKSSRSGSISTGRCDSDGKYTLSYTAEVDGAVIGKHNVLIAIGMQRFLEVAEVKEGENVINFELLTPATSPAAQP